MKTTLKAPFPWFGGKSRAAPIIWAALGDVNTYIEPFAGSLATLLARPNPRGVETVNDLDGYIVNFWRAVQAVPEEVAMWADWPVTELDLSARHAWLVTTGRERVERLAADPNYYDAQVAGWWVWGLSAWIGSGWCSGKGPWTVGPDGVFVKSSTGQGIKRQRPHISSAGQGIHRKTLSLGDDWHGITDTMLALSERLRDVSIICGDWLRVLGPAPRRAGGGVCGVLLDPPYVVGEYLYSAEATGVAQKVFAWAEEHGDDPSLRIVVCGYEGDWNPPKGWSTVPWKAGRSYKSTNDGGRERLWCSPACLPVDVPVTAQPTQA